MIKGYENIDTWIFDLDHTLYPAPSKWENRAFELFYQFVHQNYAIPMDEVKRLDEIYDAEGCYLKGWLEHIPHFDIELYWKMIDEIDMNDIPICTLTQQKIHALPGNKILFTNGNLSHADKFLNYLGLENYFDEVIAIDVHDIKQERYKPNPHIYHEIIKKMNTKGENCAMFEDSLSNLKTAHELGMSTVLVNKPDCYRHLPHVHVQFNTFTDWLIHYMPK